MPIDPAAPAQPAPAAPPASPAMPPAAPAPEAPQAAAPAQPAPAAPEALPPGVTPAPGGFQMLTTSAYKAIKEKAAATALKKAGEQHAQVLQAKLATVGAADLDVLLADYKALKNPVPGTNPVEIALQTQVTQLTAERKQLAIKLKRQSEEFNAMEGRRAMERAAASAGCTDVDFGLYKAEKHLAQLAAGKSGADAEAAMAGFDAAKFFTELKGQHPHAFAVVTKPANTSTQNPAAPKPPTPPQAANQPGTGHEKKDVMKMNREEYAAYRKTRGLPSAAPHTGQI